MKIRRRYIGIVVSMLMVSTLTMTGCGSSSNDNPPESVAPIEKSEISIPISVSDTSGNPIDDALLVIRGEVSDAEGNPLPSVKTIEGQALVYAKTKENNIVRITAKKEGFVDSGAEVDASKAGEYLVILKMINIEGETLEGVDPKQEIVENAIDTNGVTTQQIDLSAENAKVSIPKGAKLTAADGTEVSGALKVTVTSFDAGATEVFPGGLDVVAASVPNAGGSSGEQAVNMISAGFVSIDIEDEDGKRVKNGDFNVTMNVTNATNPETGNPVKAGDIIPIWSYDESTGKWTYEGDGIVVDNNGMLEVTTSTKHLTYYNLDYWRAPRCRMTINITGGKDLRTNWRFSFPGWSHGASDYRGDGRLDLFNAPANREVSASVSLNGTKLLDTLLSFSDPDRDGQCNAQVVDISNLLPEYVESTISFTESCPDGSKLNPVPNVNLYTYNPSYVGYGLTGADGKITIPLAENTSANPRYYLPLGYNSVRYVGARGGTYKYMYGSSSVEAGNDKTLNFTLSPEFCTPPTSTGSSGGS